MPGGALVGGGWFWLTLLLTFWLTMALIGSPKEGSPRAHDPEMRMILPEELPASVRESMDVRLAIEKSGSQIFRGKLREPAQRVFERLKLALPKGTTPLVQEDELGAAIVLSQAPPNTAAERPIRPAIHWLLFRLDCDYNDLGRRGA